MHRRVVVSLARLFRDEVPGALPRGRLNDGLPRLKTIRAHMHKDRPQTSGLPDVGRVLEAAGWLRSQAQVLVVAGQPGALLAARVWVDALAPGALVRFVGAPDADLLEGGSGVALLALLGPEWVDDAVEAAVAAGRAVLVAGPPPEDLEEGEVIEPPPGGHWLDDPYAGDGRFGALGASSMVIAAFAGVDVAGVVEGAAEMQSACARPALTENPAYSYALACVYAERDLGLRGAAHVTSSAKLETFVGWAARTWASTMTGATAVGTLRSRAGAAPLFGLIGDEELTEMLFEGPREFLVTTWEPNASAHDAALLSLTRDRPSIRVHLHDVDARSLGAAAALVCRAAVIGALFTDRNPRTLASLSAWREATSIAVDVADRAGAAVDAGGAVE